MPFITDEDTEAQSKEGMGLSLHIRPQTGSWASDGSLSFPTY